MPIDSKRIALGWPNYIDEAVLSGGRWLSTLPLTHLQDARTAVVAKSASLAPDDTQCWIHLPKRRRIHALCLYAHNLSSTATIRAQVYRDPAGEDLIYDSGPVYAWPIAYGLDDVLWGDDNFWSRRLSDDARESYTSRSMVIFDDRLIASAVHVEIHDPANLEGGVTLGRALLVDVWQPRYNVNFGIKHGYDSGTEVKTAKDQNRTRYARRVTPKRTASFDLGHLDESEAFLRLHRLQRTQDIVGEILYIYSTDPTPENFARNMVCHQTSLDPLNHSHVANFENGMSLLEIL